MIPKYLKQAEGTRRCPGEIWSINNDFSKKSIAHTSRFALSLTQPHFSTFASNRYTIYTLQQLPTFSATLSLYWPILPFNLQISAHLCTILDYTTLHPLPYVWQCSLNHWNLTPYNSLYFPTSTFPILLHLLKVPFHHTHLCSIALPELRFSFLELLTLLC